MPLPGPSQRSGVITTGGPDAAIVGKGVVSTRPPSIPVKPNAPLPPPSSRTPDEIHPVGRAVNFSPPKPGLSTLSIKTNKLSPVPKPSGAVSTPAKRSHSATSGSSDDFTQVADGLLQEAASAHLRAAHSMPHTAVRPSSAVHIPPLPTDIDFGPEGPLATLFDEDEEEFCTPRAGAGLKRHKSAPVNALEALLDSCGSPSLLSTTPWDPLPGGISQAGDMHPQAAALNPLAGQFADGIDMVLDELASSFDPNIRHTHMLPTDGRVAPGVNLGNAGMACSSDIAMSDGHHVSMQPQVQSTPRDPHSQQLPQQPSAGTHLPTNFTLDGIEQEGLQQLKLLLSGAMQEMEKGVPEPRPAGGRVVQQRQNTDMWGVHGAAPQPMVDSQQHIPSGQQQHIPHDQPHYPPGVPHLQHGFMGNELHMGLIGVGSIHGHDVGYPQGIFPPNEHNVMQLPNGQSYVNPPHMAGMQMTHSLSSMQPQHSHGMNQGWPTGDMGDMDEFMHMALGVLEGGSGSQMGSGSPQQSSCYGHSQPDKPMHPVDNIDLFDMHHGQGSSGMTSNPGTCYGQQNGAALMHQQQPAPGYGNITAPYMHDHTWVHPHDPSQGFHQTHGMPGPSCLVSQHSQHSGAPSMSMMHGAGVLLHPHHMQGLHSQTQSRSPFSASQHSDAQGSPGAASATSQQPSAANSSQSPAAGPINQLAANPPGQLPHAVNPHVMQGGMAPGSSNTDQGPIPNMALLSNCTPEASWDDDTGSQSLDLPSSQVDALLHEMLPSIDGHDEADDDGDLEKHLSLVAQQFQAIQ